MTVFVIFAKLGAIATLIFSLFISCQWMIGDFYGERLSASLESWLDNTVSPPETVLLQHLDFAEQARKRSSTNPRYKELHARLKMMHIGHLDSNSEVLAYVEEITKLHRDAAAGRPHWAYSWSNLAFMKGLLKQFDAEYYQAVDNALLYGPYESGSVYRVVQSVFPIWSELDEELKRRVHQSIANVVKMNARIAKKLKAELIEKGHIDEVCFQASFHSVSSKARLCS